jgi:very-short-patch-repair endonuclease
MRGPDRKKVKTERRLRRHSTDAETVLWLSLRDRRLCGFKFVRQEAIESFVVDFVCRERKLVVEVDGGQHSENESDRVRDEALKTAGYQVLRFWNSDVLRNKNGVLEVIANMLNGVDV